MIMTNADQIKVQKILDSIRKQPPTIVEKNQQLDITVDTRLPIYSLDENEIKKLGKAVIATNHIDIGAKVILCIRYHMDDHNGRDLLPDQEEWHLDCFGNIILKPPRRTPKDNCTECAGTGVVTLLVSTQPCKSCFK